MTYGSFVLVKNLVVFGHGHAENDGRHIFKAMNPFLTLGTLTSHIKQSVNKG